MSNSDWLAQQFETYRPHLRAVAYRMLGSRSEADDAIQESWLRLARSDPEAINDMRAWLTTVVGRICLDMLRARRASREQYVGSWLPEPTLNQDGPAGPEGPEEHAELADSVGMALLVVLETLTPAERLAFVLHDVFAMPFEEIATVLDRTPDAARQLASRGRRRVQDAPQPDADLVQQRRAVDAFLAAARDGDFEALVAVLDPDVTFRIDVGPVGAPRARKPLVGAEAVAREVLASAPRFIRGVRPAIVNGSAGAVFGDPAHPAGVISMTVVDGRIVEIDIVADPAKLPR
jgi:RNA polymerase sigma factor (sigma-70 family)